MKPSLVAVSTLLLLAACGSPASDVAVGASPTSSEPAPSESTPSGDLYVGTGMVLERPDKDPVFCLGGINTSLPPQCGGLRLEGWDWKLIDNEDTARGTTWGDATITGRYDGESFEVVEAGMPATPPTDDDPIQTLCDEPAEGWSPVDPSKASEGDKNRVLQRVRQEPDFAGVWIDYLEEPAEFEDTPFVLNVAFTGDLERHEAEIRTEWGGPLCLVEFEHTLAELTKIQNELSGPVGKEIGLEVLGSSAGEYNNKVEISAVVVTEEMLAELERRYGSDVVEVQARLEPVER